MTIGKKSAMSTTHLAKRMFFFLALSAFVLALCGCWDRREVNNLSLITAVAFDQQDERHVRLSVQVFVPKASEGGADQTLGGQGRGSGGTQPTFVRSAVGVSAADAISKLQRELPRYIFWGHANVFLFGEQLARRGIRDQVDFLLRDPHPRERAYVFVTEGNAVDMLEMLPRLERNSAQILAQLAKSQLELKVTLNDLAQMLNGETGAALLPWVEKLSSEGDGQNGRQPAPYINGTGVFKDGRLIGRLDEGTTRGVLWLRDEVRRSIITVTDKQTQGTVSVSVQRSITKFIPRMEDGRLSLTVKAKITGSIIQNTTNRYSLDPEFFPWLEKELEQDVKRRMGQALNQAQGRMKADIFDFAGAFHRKYPKEWKQVKDRWADVYPQVQVGMEVKAKVLRPGIVTEEARTPKNEVKKQ